MTGRCSCSRREFLVAGPLRHRRRRRPAADPEPHVGRACRAGLEGHERREPTPSGFSWSIELSGGNDGLNTVVPYGDAPTIAPGRSSGSRKRRSSRSPTASASTLDGGLRAALQGRLAGRRARLRLRPSQPVAFLVDGVLAHRRAERRRVARMAGPAGRARYDPSSATSIVNIGSSQSLAVRSRDHSPLVFDDPARFRREGTDAEKRALAGLSSARATTNADARVPRLDRAERDRELGLRSPGLGQLSHAGGLRHRRRVGRQPPASRGADRRAGCRRASTT